MILALDASVDGFLVGILDANGKIIYEISNTTPYSHTQFLVPAINQLMSECNIQFQDLANIITTNGPGSFTGIRVGLATAAGLQAALNIPVITVNTLAALIYSWSSRPMQDSKRIHAVLDTKCGEVYHQAYESREENVIAIGEPLSIPVSSLKTLCNSTEDIIAPLSSSQTLQGISHKVVDITLSGLWQAAQQSSPSNLQPLYVRPAAITKTKA